MSYELVFESVTRKSSSEATTERTQPELSVGVKKLLENAVAEARKRGHHYIGSEHLLLGMLVYPEREITDLLSQLKMKPDDIRKSIEQVLSEPPRAESQQYGTFTLFSRQLQITITPKPSTQQEKLIAQIPLISFMGQITKGEKGTVRIENDSYSVEISIE
jgi:ATP-dependent Clp protease ATP-binding subunit ClpA